MKRPKVLTWEQAINARPKRNNSPRSRFLSQFEDKKLGAVVWDILGKLEVVDRQLERLGAPQYRRVR